MRSSLLVFASVFAVATACPGHDHHHDDEHHRPQPVDQAAIDEFMNFDYGSLGVNFLEDEKPLSPWEELSLLVPFVEAKDVDEKTETWAVVFEHESCAGSEECFKAEMQMLALARHANNKKYNIKFGRVRADEAALLRSSLLDDLAVESQPALRLFGFRVSNTVFLDLLNDAQSAALIDHLMNPTVHEIRKIDDIRTLISRFPAASVRVLFHANGLDSRTLQIGRLVTPDNYFIECAFADQKADFKIPGIEKNEVMILRDGEVVTLSAERVARAQDANKLDSLVLMHTLPELLASNETFRLPESTYPTLYLFSPEGVVSPFQSAVAATVRTRDQAVVVRVQTTGVTARGEDAYGDAHLMDLFSVSDGEQVVMFDDQEKVALYGIVGDVTEAQVISMVEAVLAKSEEAKNYKIGSNSSFEVKKIPDGHSILDEVGSIDGEKTTDRTDDTSAEKIKKDEL